MKYFKTKREIKRLLYISSIIILPLLYFLDNPLIINILIVAPIILLPLLFTNELIVNEEKIIVNYPFIKKRNIIFWNQVKELKIFYKDALIYGSFNPGYIQINIINNKVKRVFYKVSYEELQILEEIVKAKEKSFVVINNPFIKY